MLQGLLILVALGAFIGRFFGVFDLSALNTVSNWLTGRPVLVPELAASSGWAGMEDMWLRWIDALVWGAIVLGAGIVVLFSLPPTSDNSN